MRWRGWSTVVWSHTVLYAELPSAPPTHRRLAMDYVGIDASKNQSQIYLFTETGEVLHQHLYTQREQLRAVLIGASASRPVREAGSEGGAGTAAGSLSRLSYGDSPDGCCGTTEISFPATFA
jgi:hypothetical protein